MTPREGAFLRAIERLTVNGVSPSFAELRDDMGWKSVSNVHRIVGSLEEQGRLARDPNRPRRLRVIDPLRVEIGRLVDLHGHDKVARAVALCEPRSGA